MNKFILLVSVLVLALFGSRVESADEEYLGYVYLNFVDATRDDIYCLVTAVGDTKTIPALYGPVVLDTEEVYENCIYWNVINVTSDADENTRMVLQTGDSGLYLNVLNSTIGTPSLGLELSSTDNDPIAFAVDETLHLADLEDFLDESVFVNIAFEISFVTFTVFCMKLGSEFDTKLHRVDTEFSGLFGANVCLEVDKWSFELFSHCHSSPCENGGTCATDSMVDYTCECPEPYGGRNCDLESPCNNNPCVNGECTETEDFLDYTCTCPDFYFGKNCDIEDPCKDRNCTCTATEDGLDYTCTCLDTSDITEGIAQCGKDCDTDCKLGCISNDTRRGDTLIFDGCSDRDIRKARKKEGELRCRSSRSGRRNVCRAMTQSQIEQCGSSCRELDCVSKDVIEGDDCDCSGRYARHARWGKGGWWRRYGRKWIKRCRIPSNVTSCFV